MKRMKKVLAILLAVAVFAVGAITVASARTEKYEDGSKWKYGSATCREYSKYYRPSGGGHSAEVTLDNGDYKKAIAFPDDFPGSDGWASAVKSNFWNLAKYDKHDYWI